MLGKTFSEESRKKIGLGNSVYIGEKNSRWIKDRSFLIYPDEWKEELKDSIRKRDNYTCKMPGCVIHQNELKGRFKKLDVHHIDYNKKNLNPNNLVTLCRKHHIKTNSNRKYWKEFFYKIIKNIIIWK
jgi:hypothetical protein